MNLYDLYRAVKTGYAPDLRTMGYARVLRNAAVSVIKTLSGALPLSFVANGQPLLGYTLYGDAVQDGTPAPDAPVDVVGCGDRTENLLDFNAEAIERIGSFGSLECAGKTVKFVLEDGKTNYGFYIVSNLMLKKGSYTISAQITDTLTVKDASSYGFRIKIGGTWTDCKPNQKITLIEDAPITAAFYTGMPNKGSGYVEVSNIMLNAGETALPYEPHGYRIPISVQAEDGAEILTTIYLDKPLHKVSEYADYLCYSTQSITRYCGADDTGVYLLAEPVTESIDLPQIPTCNGMTTLDASTAVKPSSMEIKYR